MVRQKFANSHKDPLNKLETKISQDATVSKALQMMEAATNSSVGGTPARTMASPQWGSDAPVNFRKLLNLASISVSEFDTNNRYLPFAYLKVSFSSVLCVCCSLSGSPFFTFNFQARSMCGHRTGAESSVGFDHKWKPLGVEQVQQRSKHWTWRAFRVQCGELSRNQFRCEFSFNKNHIMFFQCSFNLFSFITLPLLDTHATHPTAIPWHVTEDRTLVSVLPLAAGEKKLQSIAEATCDVTRQRGVTELRMVDHGITPKMQAWYVDKNLTSFLMFHCFFTLQVNADGNQVPLSYRYVIQPAVKVNAFKPKDLTPNDDKLNLRAAQFGAVWSSKFHTLPKTEHCDVVWEAQRFKTIQNTVTNCSNHSLSIFFGKPSLMFHQVSMDSGVDQSSHTTCAYHLAGAHWRECAVQFDSGQTQVLPTGPAKPCCCFGRETEIRKWQWEKKVNSCFV